MNLPLELARAVQKAVALAQREKSTWIRADLIMYLGRVLPRTGMAPAAAAALLEDLADPRCVRGSSRFLESSCHGNDPHHALWVLILVLGLRRGEAMA